MNSLSHHDVVTLLLAVAILLGASRVLGELFSRFHQPAVIGELLAGILLGPTVFGSLFPAAHEAIFPSTGAFPIALEALTGIAIVLFLLVAGMEVDLSTVWQQGKTALYVGFLGILVPFITGFCFSWFTPFFQNTDIHRDHLVFSLFLATALSISALPVIAKILMDLGLFRTDVGMVVIAAAILNDLAGWIIFALLLGMFSTGQEHSNVGLTVLLLFLFIVFMLTLGRRLLNWVLPWVQAHTTWPGGVLGLSLAAALACAAYTEWIGIHGIFGAFLFGVALGDSRHLRGRTRRTLEQFISFIFAPLFFASIGLKVNFIANFSFSYVVVILLLATVGKVFGCGLGAWLGGMGRRESWAVGFAMNARGAMEIILGLLALNAGLIGERLFVALVIMALVTSMSGAFFMQLILHQKKRKKFWECLHSKAFLPSLESADHQGAIEELARHLAPLASLDPDLVARHVWQREQIMSTSLGLGVAAPHARLTELRDPVMAIGFSHEGVDFDAADGEPVHLICLILTPAEDPDSQINVLADLARTFQRPGVAQKLMAARTTTELLSIFKTEDARFPDRL